MENDIYSNELNAKNIQESCTNDTRKRFSVEEIGLYLEPFFFICHFVSFYFHFYDIWVNSILRNSSLERVNR